jgi:hypothetical protein
MANWYTTREAVKRALLLAGDDRNRQVDDLVEAASRQIERFTRRFFIPRTETRKYYWPQETVTSWRLWLDQGIISVSSLTTDNGDTTIPSTNYFLEPLNFGPPYDRIEINLATSSFFSARTTRQRAIAVTGDWGWDANTQAAGTLAAAMDASQTTLDCSDASLIEVGDTLLIESERLFVSGRSTLSTTATLNGALTATQNQVSITVSNGSLIKRGETILVDSERMYVSDVVGNVLTVIRAYDGSILASHADTSIIYAYRRLTVERAANGTTAATHANSTAISKYLVPADIAELCRAEVIAAYTQEAYGWGRQVGTGEGQREFSGRDLAALRERVINRYRRMVLEAV